MIRSTIALTAPLPNDGSPLVTKWVPPTHANASAANDSKRKEFDRDPAIVTTCVCRQRLVRPGWPDLISAPDLIESKN